jgi:hypothetical protein
MFVELHPSSFTVEVAMASTQCHALSRLRVHPVMLPLQVPLPQLIAGTIGS